MLNEDIKSSSEIEEQIKDFIKDCEHYDLPRLGSLTASDMNA